MRYVLYTALSDVAGERNLAYFDEKKFVYRSIGLTFVWIYRF